MSVDIVEEIYDAKSVRKVSGWLSFEVSNWLPEYDPLVVPGVALE